MRAHWMPLAAVVALLACGVVACGSSGPARPSQNGPLSSGNRGGPVPKGLTCAPGGEGPIAFGDQEYTNYGHSTVTLERIVLTRPRNQRILAAWVMPGTGLIGLVRWPPERSDGFPVPAAWKHRQPVRGYRVAPGGVFNMVLALEPAGAGRSVSSGTLVYYRDAGRAYVAPNYFESIIAATKAGCNSV